MFKKIPCAKGFALIYFIALLTAHSTIFSPTAVAREEITRDQYEFESGGPSGPTDLGGSNSSVGGSTQNTPAPEGVLQLECGYGSFPDCNLVKKELVEGRTGYRSVIGIRAVADEIASGIYEGKLYPAGRKGPNGEAREAEEFGKPPICPPIPVTLNQCKDEIEKNHLNQECGSMVNIYMNKPGQFVSSLGGQSCGSRESTNVAGSFIVILSDVYNRLKSEVSQNRMVISPSSACYGQAKDLQGLIKEHKLASNMEEIKSCDTNGMNDCSAKKYFEAGIESIRAAYLMVARCRMIEESTKAYRQFSAQAIAEIKRSVIDQLGNCNGQFPLTDPSKRTAFQACYYNNYRVWFKNYLKTKYPNAAQGCS